MMKFLRFLLPITVLFCFFGQAKGQNNPDSSSFEVQRSRVNDLLDARQQKFGAYDTSLTQKTGFFGLFKSKGDMQKSIDILKDIVITDNNIFLETQKLLKIKDFEKDKYQQLATDYDKQVSAYIGTISKLQKENEKLRAQIDKTSGNGGIGNILLYIALLVIAVLGYLLYKFKAQQTASKQQNSG
ncbi:hypothetical protein BCY89_25480 [Sphingobacterium siyangense]|uniref:Uncharacterized protein n=1 Tax=Sphingobacterium siyangense TaxID=459529 RepID=A0A420G3L5_9SPHI|nr:hypothetical protein [Sphingobacterium siyangense]QRY57850.1 hypothetical protein JVX97_28415 [Sphingobacterium siyangense]RKF39755.1 hypothetical protein BCY89_25480 [Sphingobacterium siyangense]